MVPDTKPRPGVLPTSAWHPLGRALADVIDRAFLVYLKEDRDMGYGWRLVNAFLGGVAFYLCVLLRQYYRVQAIAYEIDRIQDNAQTNIDAAAQVALLQSVSTEFISFVGLAIALAALVTPVIAWGVRRGGPLRFFFAGVTVPAAVFFFANRIG